MKPAIKSIIILISISLALQFVISPLRIFFGMKISAVVGFFVYFVFTILALRKCITNKETITYSFCILTGILLIQIPVRIIDFKDSLISLPDTINHIFAIILGVCFSYSLQKFFRYGIIVLSILLNVFIFITGYNLWFNKLNYGSFSGHVKAFQKSSLFGTNINNEKISFNKGNYTVLDLWFSRCGACFREFPEFEALKEKYKSKSNIAFYALNVPIDSDTIGVTSFRLIREKKYSFENLQAPNNIEIKKLGIDTYPTHLIFDKKGNIIYKGDLNGLNDELKKINN